MPILLHRRKRTRSCTSPIRDHRATVHARYPHRRLAGQERTSPMSPVSRLQTLKPPLPQATSLRCSEEHFSKECPRPREEPATCINCNVAHPANSIACPQYQKERTNLRAGAVAITAPQPEKTTIHADTHSASLMAPANDPTPRGSLLKSKKKKKTKAPAQAPSIPAASSKPSTQKKQQANETLNKALNILKDILIALRAGQDPTNVVLEGLTTLVTKYH